MFGVSFWPDPLDQRSFMCKSSEGDCVPQEEKIILWFSITATLLLGLALLLIFITRT